MAGNGSGRVGYKRVIIISVLATIAAITFDRIGLIDYIARRV
jgi:hypothetical protein